MPPQPINMFDILSKTCTIRITFLTFVPLAVKYHRKKNPLRCVDLSVVNLMYSELPNEDILERIFEPQYLPINGDVGYPPFL